MLHVIFLIIILSGIAAALTNLIPMNYTIPNDGMNLRCMRRDKNTREALYLQLEVNAQMSDGKQMIDYPAEKFILPEGINDTNMLTAAVHFLSYYQQLANLKFDKAEEILRSMEEKLAYYLPANLNLLELERLFFMVLKHSPIEEIASIYARSRILMAKAKTNIEVQRVRYVYETFMSEEEKKDILTLVTKTPIKRWKESNEEKLYQELLKTVANYPVSGQADMNLQIVNYIRENYPNIGLDAEINL